MRWMRNKDDGMNGFVAGCVAGYLSAFLLDTPKKIFIILTFLSRGVDCIYNSMVNKGYIAKKSYHGFLLYYFTSILLSSSITFERRLLDEGFYKSFIWISAAGKQDKTFLFNLTHEICRRNVAKKFPHTADEYLK